MVNQKQIKVEFLDGLGGLCAVYIALYYSQLYTGHGFETSELHVALRILMHFLSLGHYSFSIFIVLSGLYLSIPFSQFGSYTPTGGVWSYFRRRTERILPPYYTALLLFIALIAYGAVSQVAEQTAWDSKIPGTAQSIIAHLMVHNFPKTEFLKIDGPMRSVATGWQIYFIFSILLFIIIIQLRGVMLSITAAIVLGTWPAILLPAEYNFSWIYPRYLTHFIFGSLSAFFIFSEEEQFATLRRNINWRKSGLFVIVAIPVLLVVARYHLSLGIVETLLSLLVFIILVEFILIELKGEHQPMLLRILDSKIAKYLGVVSYSIYLIQSLTLGPYNLLTLHIDLSHEYRLVMMLLFATPVAVMCSVVFYYTIEKQSVSFFQRNLTPRSLNERPRVATKI